MLLAAAAFTGCGGSGSMSSHAVTFHQWIWQGGSQTPNKPGNYGTLGQPSTQNIPGARLGSSYWTDAQGNFWLFGGHGIASQQSIGDLEDVWKFNPFSGQWTWVCGPQQANQPPVYDTKGVPSADNLPSGRANAQSWIDPQGNFWLFSGSLFSDMWKFTPSIAEWTFMGGSTNLPTSAPNKGIYGTLGQPSPTNLPGPRGSAVTWSDSQGNLWMYGGEGNDSRGIGGTLGDLWEYSPSTGEWTWMGGSPIGGEAVVYGTKGVTSPSNAPGARAGSLFWSDGKGDVWLFGGSDTGGAGGEGNDLWKYSNGEWTWIAGSDQPTQLGSYGSEGDTSPTNNPGSRSNSVTWTDAQGNLWLFGGNGQASKPSFFMELSDLWEFTNGQWIWVNGPDTIVDYGSYGTLGVASVSNLPPARSFASGWVDQSGNLWLFGGSASLDFGTTWYNDLWEYTP
uniref:Galactose oxidase n=1 Tax=mine drainage metagenome TaxID=410659 RepID=E6QN22_9ZZZZ